MGEKVITHRESDITHKIFMFLIFINKSSKAVALDTSFERKF